MLKTGNSGSQLELFSKEGAVFQARKLPEEHSFVKFLRSCEKNTLLAVGIFVIGIVSFSLGVQKGREGTVPRQACLVKRQPSLAKHQAPTAALNDSRLPDAELAPALKASLKAGGSYTIQLASYKKKEGAQKVALSLKKNGFLPIILSKGKYVVLCAGSFTDKKEAQALLFKFRKDYRDCRVRQIN